MGDAGYEHGSSSLLSPKKRVGNEDGSLAPSKVYLSKQVSYIELAKLTATNNMEVYLVLFEQASPSQKKKKKSKVPRRKLPGPCVTVHCA